MAQDGSKRPSEGPRESEEAPTLQMRLDPLTLPSATGPKNPHVAICPHILRSATVPLARSGVPQGSCSPERSKIVVS